VLTVTVIHTRELMPSKFLTAAKSSRGFLKFSVKLPGMYDFETELSDDVQTGEEMIYIANSSEPSDDDEIAEFYDDTGMEVTKVPQSKKIILSVWLREGIIYAPVVVVKED